MDEGGQALSFDGKGTFITLPQGVIPRLAAFTIQMRLRPDNLEGRQTLIANRAHYGDSLMVHLENGEVCAKSQPNRSETQTRARSGIFLKDEMWQELTLRYDQETLTVVVDGKRSEPLPLPGPGLYDTVSVVGGHDQAWLQGQIADLRIPARGE